MADPSTPFNGKLPTPRTGLIGRTTERDMAHARLVDMGTPLLTLTGPGGSGKTRLAIAIAHDVAPRFADGAYWVDLAPLSDPWVTPVAVARALGFVPAAGLPVEGQLIRELRPRQVLLVLDNCEHLLHAVSDLAALLLNACPALQILATSRSRLHHRVEQELPVEPFPLPQDGARPDVLSGNEAVRLFVERSSGADPGFALSDANAAVVAAICRRLDGLPLAIELAASWTKVVPLDALLTLMGDRLRLLRGGPRDLPARQQTIRDTIAWSYALLTPDQQAFFRRLSVFAGGWALDAARCLAFDRADAAADLLDDLAALVDHSLVRRINIGGSARFTMLETIREFGLAELTDDEDDDARRQHAAWCLSLVEDMHLHDTMRRDSARMNRLHPEQDNVRTALAWFASQGEAVSLSVMSAAMSIYWPSVGQFAEARSWLHQAIAHNSGVPTALRTRVVHEAAWLAMCQGDLDAAGPMRDEALRLARQAGEPYLLAEAILGSGTHAFWMGDLDRAEALTHEALRSFESLLARFPSASAKVCAAFTFLGNIALVRGDVPLAVEHGNGAVAIARTPVATAELGYALCGLAYARLLAGDLKEAGSGLLEAVALTWWSGDDAFLARLFWGVAALATADGMPTAAARLIDAADALDARTGAALWPADHVVADWCRRHLASAIEPDALEALRSADAALSKERAVAAVRSVVSAILGTEQADAIWRSIGAPEPKAHGDDVLLPPAMVDHVHPVTIGVRLTRREQDVLQLMCLHLTDREIATRLYISPRTVSIHVGNVLAKLGATSRRDVAAIVARTDGNVGAIVRSSHPALGATGAGTAFAGLTARELDVLTLLIDGHSDRAIAGRLLISRRTVSKHVEAILSKLGVHSRGAAVAEVLRVGWGAPNPRTEPNA